MDFPHSTIPILLHQSAVIQTYRFIGSSRRIFTVNSVSYTHLDVYKRQIPLLSKIPVIGDIFFNYGFLTYFAIIITLLMAFFLKRTRWGLNLNAVGESPATADAAGINVTLYKYLATVIGGGTVSYTHLDVYKRQIRDIRCDFNGTERGLSHDYFSSERCV